MMHLCNVQPGYAECYTDTHAGWVDCKEIRVSLDLESGKERTALCGCRRMPTARCGAWATSPRTRAAGGALSDRDEFTPQRRRHVAHKLRLWAHAHRKDTWEHSSLDLELMAKTGGCTPSEVADALVGLIDPTCEVTVVGERPWATCDLCGTKFRRYQSRRLAAFCPVCGARVAYVHEEDEGDD